MMQVCPVCGGKQVVPLGFYNFPGAVTTTASSMETQTCRTCNGTGVVFCPSCPAPVERWGWPPDGYRKPPKIYCNDVVYEVTI